MRDQELDGDAVSGGLWKGLGRGRPGAAETMRSGDCWPVIMKDVADGEGEDVSDGVVVWCTWGVGE